MVLTGRIHELYCGLPSVSLEFAHEPQGVVALAPEAGARPVLSDLPLRVLAASEGVAESLQKLLVHEAVGDGITARGRVRQEVQEGYPEGAQGAVHLLRDVQTQDVHDEDRRPAEEELEDDHEQHPDHVLLGFDALLEVRAPQPLEVVLLLLLLGRAGMVPAVLRD